MPARPPRRMREIAGTVAVLVALHPPTLAAQVGLEVTPYVMGHLPVLDYNRIWTNSTSPLGGATQVGDMKQTTALGAGGKVTWWTNRVYGVELDVQYVASGTRVAPRKAQVIAGELEQAGHQWTATVSLMLRPVNTPLIVGIGAGYTVRGGKAWDREALGLDGTFDRGNITTVVSLGTRLHAGVVSFRPSLDAQVYWVRKYDPTSRVALRPRDMQIDLQAKLGVPIGL